MDLARVAQWRRRGVINFETEQRIVEAEGGKYPDAQPLRWREALAYLGGLLLLGGGLALAFEVSTPDLFQQGGSDVVALLIALLVATGLAASAWFLDIDDPVSRRAVGFLAASAVVALGAAAGIIFFDLINPSDGSVLMLGVITTAAGYTAWRWLPTSPTQVALHFSVWIVITGLLITLGVDDGAFGLLGFTGATVLSGLLLLALGLGWMVLTYTRFMEPMVTGYVLGIIAAWAGTQILVADSTAWVIVQLAMG